MCLKIERMTVADHTRYFGASLIVGQTRFAHQIIFPTVAIHPVPVSDPRVRGYVVVGGPSSSRRATITERKLPPGRSPILGALNMSSISNVETLHTLEEMCQRNFL